MRLGGTVAGDDAGNEAVEQLQGGLDVAVLEPGRPMLVGQLPDYAGVGGIDRNGRGQVAQAQVSLHGQDELLDDHAGLFAHDRRAQDLSRRGRDDLGEAVGQSVDSSAVDLGEIEPVDPDRAAARRGPGSR